MRVNQTELTTFPRRSVYDQRGKIGLVIFRNTPADISLAIVKVARSVCLIR
jgi:hypothetical protein